MCLPWTQYFSCTLYLSCTISALGLNTTVPTMERLCMVVLHFSVPFSASSKENKTGVFGFLSSLCLDCIESSLNFVLVYSSSFSFCTLGFGVSTFFSSTLGSSVTVQQPPDGFTYFTFCQNFLETFSAAYWCKKKVWFDSLLIILLPAKIAIIQRDHFGP